MAKYLHSDVLNGGLLALKNNATKMCLANAYSLGDSYATFMTHVICTVNIGPSDLTISGVDAGPLILTSAIKSQAAVLGSGPTPDLVVGFTNGVDKIYWVTDETANAVIASGNTINFPAFALVFDQPV